MPDKLSRLFLIIIVLFAAIIGCGPRPVQTQSQNRNSEPSQGQNAAASSDDFLKPAENLAKRVSLYKIAWQEGDLTPFVARVEEVKDLNLPEAAKQFSEYWWRIDWTTTRLAPLPINELTALEPVTFPLITARLDEQDTQAGWCLYTLGYDPDAIRPYVADAHTNWTPEERELLLNGTEPGCLQVWLVRLGGEWKVLANITCISSIARPEPPRSAPESPNAGEPNTSGAQSEEIETPR